jgi:serine O-acetyltransferase
MVTIKKIRLFFNLIRVWPHLILFVVHPKKNLIGEDVKAWRNALGLKESIVYSFLFLLANYPEFRNICYLRFGLIGSVLNLFCPKLNSLYITTSDIKGGLFIQHGFASIISAKTIGENCWINQQVTIGYSNKTDCPVLEDNVTIYAGAKVIGGINIGQNSIIGANCVVVKNVPANCVVVGNPARIVRKNGVKVNIPL